jgi:Amt family ammonium transporter
MIDGNFHQIGNQLVAVLIAIVLAVVGTFVILKVVDLVIGLRVSAEHEVEGLDLTQHGEEGYAWEPSLP